MVRLIFTVLLVAFAAGQDADPWPLRWNVLGRLLRQEDSLLRDDLQESQRSLARTMNSGADDLERFRIGLLGAALGRPSPEWQAAVLPEGLTEQESELAMRYLPPGAARTASLIRALEQGPQLTPEVLLARQNLGYQVFKEDLDAFRVGPAQALATAMHASAQATWSAFCLEGVARRTGNTQLALDVLARQIAATPLSAQTERIDLITRHAIAAAGAGKESLELRQLGLAARMGGDDALQILGKLALEQGHRERAKRLFSTLLTRARIQNREPAPWALRGWGLSLVDRSGSVADKRPAASDK